MMITRLNTEDHRRCTTQLPNQHKKIMCGQGVPTCPSRFQFDSKKVPMTTNTLDHTKKLNFEQKYVLLNEKYLFLSFQCFFRGQRSCGHGVLCGQLGISSSLDFDFYIGKNFIITVRLKLLNEEEQFKHKLNIE